MTNEQQLAFDHISPWGTHALTRNIAKRLNRCQRVSSWKGFGRVAFWLRHPLKHDLSGPVDTEIWGLKMRLMPRGNLSESRMLFLPGLFDWKERRYLQQKLQPGAVFLDIGANAGAYSFWVYSCLKTDCSIYAIEPDPELQKRITFNAATNGATSITPIGHALSDQSGEMQLAVTQGNRGQNVLQAVGSNAATIPVHVTTLLSLVQDYKISRIDSLKIDVEGHEYRVMQHFFQTADKALWPGSIICETCTKEQSEGMGKLLSQMGYKRVCSGKMNDIFERKMTLHLC